MAGPDSSGHWASKSVHEQHVGATRSVQIGIRSHDVWMDPGRTSRELGHRIVKEAIRIIQGMAAWT